MSNSPKDGIKYQELEQWIDRILAQDIPNSVVGFCFYINRNEKAANSWSLELVGTKRFNKDSSEPMKVVCRFNEENDAFVFTSETGRDKLLYEVRVYLKKYMERGRFKSVLKSRAGVVVAYYDLIRSAVVYKNKEYKQPMDLRTFMIKLVNIIAVVGSGVFLSIMGAIMTFVWEKGPGKKKLFHWEVEFNNSQSVGAVLFVIGIIVVFIGAWFYLKENCIQMLLGIILMAVGFGIPIIMFIKVGRKAFMFYGFLGLGVCGLYIFGTYLLRIIGLKHISEKADNWVSDVLTELVWGNIKNESEQEEDDYY